MKSKELNIKRGWRWFTVCLYNRNPRNGLGWYFESGDTFYDVGYHIGHFSEGHLNEWGIKTELSFNGESVQSIGTFQHGDLVSGSIDQRFKGPAATWQSYNGTLVDCQYEGEGILTSHKGYSYQGQFVDGKYHGNGKMLWKNGFEYEGLWSHNQPVDKGKCVHPEIKYYLEKSICTRTVTGKSATDSYGQWIYDGYCLNCATTCHHHDPEDVFAGRKFCASSYCLCSELDCKWREPDRAKRRKILIKTNI